MSDTLNWDVNCLALDLGTNTGYATNANGFRAGTWELATAAQTKARRVDRLDRRCDPRIRYFYDKLKARDEGINFDLVVFEDVQFQSYTMQCQLWSSYRAAMWLAFPRAHFECVPVSTLKKFATGHGGAIKEMMANALTRQHPNALWAGLDDNAVDAVWLWLWAKRNFGRLKPVDIKKLRDTL